MTTRTGKQIVFTTDLNWIGGDMGIVSSQSIKQSIHVTTAPEFGGEEGEWSPEYLFLSSLTSCFMSTYMVFVKKLKFEISHFECTATGQAEVVDGKYKFTYVHLYPKILIACESEMEQAQLALEKTQKYCLISNSMNAVIIYHPEVMIARPAPESTETSGGTLHKSLPGMSKQADKKSKLIL